MAISGTPLCIMFDTEKKMKVLFDQTLVGNNVVVHPLRNTASVNITFDDLCRFTEHFGHSFRLADVYKENSCR